MSLHLLESSRRCGRFCSFAEFHTQVVTSGEMKYGWIDDKFYQLYPGGRCIDYTQTVVRAAKRYAEARAQEGKL